MVLNFSNPNPIIIAEKVPPNTIIMEESRKSVLNEPPSRKKAPKIENSPRNNPISVPLFLIIIYNQIKIVEMFGPRLFD